MVTVDNEKDLGRSIKENVDTLIIEGDLIKKVLRIKATGPVVWLVAVGVIGVSVVAILASPVTSFTSNAVHALTVPTAVAALGLPATITAISIAVAGGGVATLNKLRKYKIIEKTDTHIILSRK